VKTSLLITGLIALGAFSAACSPSAAQPPVSGPVDPNGPTIVAKDMAFSPSAVEIAAGKNVTVHFDNRDNSPHNLAISRDASASQKISVGEVITASSKDQVVPALVAGSYFFRCDVHTNMTGTIVVK
jgi:plastocyanin